MAKVRPSGFWFYGNEKFLGAALTIALGTTGFSLGTNLTKASEESIKEGRTRFGKQFPNMQRNLHSSPVINEYYRPVRCTEGKLLCILRIRNHENGYVSLLGVRPHDMIDGGMFNSMGARTASPEFN